MLFIDIVEREQMFKHFNLIIPQPDFKDKIVADIIELEKLRGNQINLGVNRKVFNQMKQVFHLVESLYSARIEGNRTTISDYVQDKTEGKKESQTFKEIENIEKALWFIDRCFRENPEQPINKTFLCALHKILTNELSPEKEGSYNSGGYRQGNVSISRATYTPPLNIKVPEYMDELINFINQPADLQDELLKVAIAHHRLVWIHPFDNGNGRMARILTYAMLKKAKFDKISLLNTAAIFCINREQYFENLAKADTGSAEGLLDWCRFVLSGLLSELIKLRKLLDAGFFRNHILKPAVDYTITNGLIHSEEGKVLNLSITKSDNLIMAKDIGDILNDKTPRQITYITAKMLENELLQKENSNSRKYLINIMQKHILRGVIENLSKEGFTQHLEHS